MTTRLDELLDPDAVRVEIDGRQVTSHSQPTFSRDDGGVAQATIPIYLPAGGWKPVRGMRVWVRLSDAALNILGGGAQQRDRFTGRVSDVGQVRRRDGALVVTVVATGTRAQANRTRATAAGLAAVARDVRASTAVSKLSTSLLTSPAWARPAGHTGAWGLVWSGASTGGPLIDAPRYWAPDDASWGQVLDIIAASCQRHVVAENRDGSIHIEQPPTAPVVTIPASLVAQPLEQQAAPLVNSARVVYGSQVSEPDNVQRYQLYKNPNPVKSQSTFGYRNLYNAAPATVDVHGVKINVTNSAGYSMFGVSTGMTGDPTATGTEFDTVGIHLVHTQANNVGGWLVQVEAIDSAGIESGWETVATSPSGTTITTDVVWRIPAGFAKYGTMVMVRLRIPANAATDNGGLAGRIKELGVTTAGYQHVAQDRVERWTYFDGDTPARDGERYYWLGSARSSYSVAVSDEDTGGSIPRRIATTEDTSTWATIDQQAVEVATALRDTDGAAAIALAESLLVPATALRPPTITVHVLNAIRDGHLSDVRAILAAEIGHRLKVTGAPSDVDPAITNGTGAYIAGITETLSSRSWVITLELDRT